MKTDSLYSEITTIKDTYSNSNNSVDIIIGAFGISIMLLLITSYLKNFVGEKFCWNDFLFYILELPIDIYTISITILITYYYKVDTMDGMFCLLLLSFFILLLACTCRRVFLNICKKDKFSWNDFFSSIIMKILEIAIVFFGILLITTYIL